MSAQALVIDHETQAIEAAPKVRSAQIIKSDAAKVMAVFLRASKDADVDFERLDKMQAFYERVKAQESEAAYDEAMAAAQAEMGPIAADANNPQTKSCYASYAALDRALRPIYTKHGFSLSFSSGEGAPPDHVRVVCKVACAGHKTFPYLDMPADGKGAKGGDVMTKTHATGAAFTYGQRYLLKMIFNIAVGDDNDQGGSRPVEFITAEQVSGLTALMDDAGVNRDKFLDFLQIETLAHLPRARHREVLDLIAQKKRQAAQGGR